MNTLGSMVLLEKKPYTVHFLLLPKIIVNKIIAKKLQRQPFSQPVFACLRLPAGRQGRQASTWKVRGNRIKQDEIASPDRVRGRNDNSLNRDLGRRDMLTRN